MMKGRKTPLSPKHRTGTFLPTPQASRSPRPMLEWACDERARSLCAQPDRRAPCGQHPHRPLQLALARHEGGTFILRIEDTDQTRLTDHPDEDAGPAWSP